MSKEHFAEIARVAVEYAFPGEEIVWDSPLSATVSGVPFSVSEEEYLNNQTNKQAIDLLSAHIAAVKRKVAA